MTALFLHRLQHGRLEIVLGMTSNHCAAAGASALPGHQPGDAVVWQYPSEQMFYNAMRRKGWDAKEEDMPAVVAIHNGVNERAWHQVCQYEVRARSDRGLPHVASLTVGCSLAAPTRSDGLRQGLQLW